MSYKLHVAAYGSVRDGEPLAYRVNDFCRLFGLGRKTVYSLIANGRLATIKIGSRRLIPREAALALLAGGGK
jgi:excisionase family DNA binding protein